MSGKAVLFTSLGLLLCAKAAGAADFLTSAQMDRVTAGQLLGVECGSCTLSSSNSMSTNGNTTTTNSTSGATGGSSGTGGGGGGGPSGPSGPSVLTPVQLPANLTAIIAAATIIH